MALSKAALRLKELTSLPPDHASTAEVAHLCKVSKQAVSYWIAGRNRPDPETMALLQDRFGIPMRDWLPSDDAAVESEGEAQASDRDSDSSAA